MKPCPFCDSMKLDLRRACADTWVHFIRCNNCGAEGPKIPELKYGMAGAEKAAEQDWDTR